MQDSELCNGARIYVFRMGVRQKYRPITALGHCPLQKLPICLLLKQFYWHKLLTSYKCLVYLTYTKNELDHNTFWTPKQKELSFKINSHQYVNFSYSEPM